MTTRRVALVILSFVSIFGIAKYSAIAAAANENMKEEVLKADEVRNQALQKGDADTLDRIYADDLVYTNALGEVLTKAQHLASVRGKTLGFRSFNHSDVQVRVHGNTGILTGVSTSAVEYKGNVSSSPRRFLNVYAKEGGRWLCAAHFETPAAKQ